MPQGIEETIVRSSIASMQVEERSMMPDGFEAAMDRKELAALLAFLVGK